MGMILWDYLKMVGVVLALVAALALQDAYGAPYIELGVQKEVGGCIDNGGWCSRDPLGVAAIGYEFDNGFRAHLEHTSSLIETDGGLDTFSIRYRYTFD